MSEIRYPEIVVPMVGEDGNALAILGRAIRSMKKASRDGIIPKEELKATIEEYQDEAMSGDYNHLIMTTMLWFDVT